jgi:uncharacterized cofD-like protein
VAPQLAQDLVTHWLGITARIIPVSEEPTELVALREGDLVTGEVQVDEMEKLPDKLMIQPEAPGTLEAIAAIDEVDLIVLGPRSGMTSLLCLSCATPERV